MKRALVVLLAILLAVVTIVLVAGALLPVGHVATVRARLDAAPTDVWATMTDFHRTAGWRSGIERVERLPDADGHAVWRETGRFGPMTFEVAESEPGRRLVLRIADPELPFGGSWTYRLAPADGGTVLTITEDGQVHNPLFRFMSRFVFGHHRTMETYVADLARRLEEPEPEIERVR